MLYQTIEIDKEVCHPFDCDNKNIMASPGCNLQPKELWLVGVSTGHSVAPALHTFIAKELGLPWTYCSKEFADEEQCVQQIRSGLCAGCAVVSTSMGKRLSSV